MASKSSTKIIEDLNLLRAVSVLAIIVHHAHENLYRWSTDTQHPFFDYFDGSFGPDLFFAISGYIIARDLVPRLQACRSNTEWLTASLFFWTKRVFRILPSAWLWLFLILFLSITFNETGSFGSVKTNLSATAAGILQVANFRFAFSFGDYFYGGSFVYWTLSLEEQFYILLPFLAWFGRRPLVPVLLAVIAVQLVTERAVQPITERSMLLLMVRTDALLMGVLIAIWSQKPSYPRFEPRFLGRFKWLGFALMGLATVAMLAKSAPELSGLPFKWSFISLLSAGLVWVASYDGHYLMPQGAVKQILLWVGSRSYAIYLSHIPMFFVGWEAVSRLYPDAPVGPERFWMLTLIAFPLIGVVSELNFRVIEGPLRRRGARVAAERLERRQQRLAEAS